MKVFEKISNKKRWYLWMIIAGSIMILGDFTEKYINSILIKYINFPTLSHFIALLTLITVTSLLAEEFLEI